MPETATLVPPAFCWVPDHDSTGGPEAVDLASSAGLVLDAAQRLALDVMLAERAGAPAAFEYALVASRQNLKTVCFQAAALYDLFLVGEPLVIWTAHLFSTAQEAFADIDALIEGAPHLSRRVRSVSRANGEEGLSLHSGARLMFRARSRSGGRGLSGGKVFLDEAFALEAAHMGALLPVMSAQPAPQVRYGSSAGMASSAVLRSLRDRGRAGADPTLAYVEWCDPVPGGCELDDCDHLLSRRGCALDDKERWRRANPAMGVRISVEHIAAERRAMPPVEFARERLGWWEDPATAGDDLDPVAWAVAGDPDATPGASLRLAVDVDSGLRSAAVVACGPGGDGVPVVEVVEYRRGAAWLAARVAELVERHCPGQPVGLDPAGPAGALILELEKAGVVVEPVDARSMSQACGALVAAVTAGRLRHRDEAALNTAVEGAARRDVGDGAWKWSRRDSRADISPLVAATVAHWLARSDDDAPTQGFALVISGGGS